MNAFAAVPCGIFFGEVHSGDFPLWCWWCPAGIGQIIQSRVSEAA